MISIADNMLQLLKFNTNPETSSAGMS